jgi:hypothetical protein
MSSTSCAAQQRQSARNRAAARTTLRDAFRWQAQAQQRQQQIYSSNYGDSAASRFLEVDEDRKLTGTSVNAVSCTVLLSNRCVQASSAGQHSTSLPMWRQCRLS